MDGTDSVSFKKGESSGPVTKCSVWQESSQDVKNMKIDLGEDGKS